MKVNMLIIIQKKYQEKKSVYFSYAALLVLVKNDFFYKEIFEYMKKNNIKKPYTFFDFISAIFKTVFIKTFPYE